MVFALEDTDELDSAPTEVDLFSNVMNVSFADVENMVATEVSRGFTLSHCL